MSVAADTGVGVVDKTMLLLRAVADERALDLAGLQAVTGIPRATAHRLAVALEAHGLLRRDSRGWFVLGPELMRLGRIAADSFPLAELAGPALRALRDDVGESVQLYVREGDQRRCVVSLESTHGLRWIVPQGALLPLDRGSAGRVLRSNVDVAASVEEREPGVASASAAVRDADGTLLAAISVSGPVERLSRDPLARYAEALAQAALACQVAITER